MRIWLVQRAESTPHDDDGNRRLLRIGILADILQSQGHEVVWWTSSFDHVGKKKRYQKSIRVKVKDNYFIHYLKSFGYKKNISISRLIDNQVVTNQFKKEAKLDKKKPDVILTSVPSIELSKEVMDYANKYRIPFILDIRDLWPDVFYELLPKHFGWLVKILTRPMRNKLIDICTNAKVISGITDDFINWGIEHSGRDRTVKDTCFPMAYVKSEISKKKKADAYLFWKRLGIVKNDKILNVLFIGSLSNSFVFETVFSAAKILEKEVAPVRFIFCGEGIKEPEIRELCRGSSNCVYAGWVNSGEIKTILKLSHVGLAPYVQTRNFIENIPNKPAEYLSENLLIATSLKQGRLYDLIDTEECGFSYGNDPSKLASLLRKLATSDQDLERFARNAERTFSSKLNGNEIYYSMVEFLEKIAAENSTY